MPWAVRSGSGRRTARLYALRLFRALTGPLLAAPAAAQPRRILVLRPDHIGDALFTTPALAELRRAFPDAEISALVGPWAADVYRRSPSLDRVLTLPFPAFGPSPARQPLAPYQLLWASAARLRRDGVDLALNLRFDFWWGALLAYTARIPQRVGYALPEVAPFLTRGLRYEQGRHEVVQNLALVGAAVAPQAPAGWLEAATARARLSFPVSEAEREVAAALLADYGSGDIRPVAIHPGTRGQAKLWQVAGWAAVAEALSEELGAPVLVTGSAAESELCRSVAGLARADVRAVAGQTTLGELVALFARCRLVLGVDSGPLHLAVAARVPTVHLYGPSDHVAFGPFGPAERHAVVRSGLACSPCHSLARAAPPGGCDCLRAISPEQVLAAARRVLAASELGVQPPPTAG